MAVFKAVIALSEALFFDPLQPTKKLNPARIKINNFIQTLRVLKNNVLSLILKQFQVIMEYRQEQSEKNRNTVCFPEIEQIS